MRESRAMVCNARTDMLECICRVEQSSNRPATTQKSTMNINHYAPSILLALSLMACLFITGCAGDELAQQDTMAEGMDAGMTAEVTPDSPPDLERKDSALDMEVTPPDQPAMLGASRCESASRRVTCTYRTTEVDADGTGRNVHWQVPSGTPPTEGWPVVLFFQGSLFSAGLSWDNRQGMLFGAYELTRTLKALLDQGYAVLAPEASFGGSTFWDTNIWPYNNDWESSNDHELMLALFAQIERGTFGELNPELLFATGISSGGYMTSRMAIAYPGKFKALAIVSASYATCSGVLCSVPNTLPSDHPPTLFLHGNIDATVPIYTMRRYASALDDAGIPTDQVVERFSGHEWISPGVERVPAWFERYR